MRIRHHGDRFTVPDFTGEMARAQIDWGDGTVEPYQAGAVHRYSAAADYEVKIEVRGAETVSQTGIVGLAVVDLSEF